VNSPAKPCLVVSKCIEFEACRWNGLKISSWVIKLLKPWVDFIPVCPEVELGLGVPRSPLRIVRREGSLRLVDSDNGREFTEAIRDFSSKFLNGIDEVDGFILKERSPSCGLKNVKIYPREGKVAPINSRNPGFFGKAVKKSFPGSPREDEGRLNNFRIREHFLTRIFAGARLRKVFREKSLGALVDFHSDHKLMLMAHNQEMLRELGRLVANRQKLPINRIQEAYREGFLAALAEPPSPGAVINVLMHALGYFKKKLSPREKTFFLESLEDYRNRRVPLGVPITLVSSWIVRFQEPYLARQAFFSPYPEDLVEVSDSGKGREVK